MKNSTTKITFSLRFDANDHKGGYKGSHYSMIGDWTSSAYGDERSAISAAKQQIKRMDAAAIKASRGY